MTAYRNEAERFGDTAFVGHPRGLGWLSFTELWERFSYYGMQALLVLYMTHQLLQPGHIEHVFGFGPIRYLTEGFYGAHSAQATASAVFGLYTSLVYLTPIAGGWLADNVIGRTRAVVAGASLMALGHFLMAFDVSFVLALLCLLLGTGCFKGNISAQVGGLYAPGDPRRADAFQIFLFSVQLAVIASPFVCGTLAQVYGWHWGFGAAGVGMLIGLTIYLLGRPWLPPEAPIVRNKANQPPRVPLTTNERWQVALLVALVPVLALGSVANGQVFNAYLVWGEANFQLQFFGYTMPITWILSFGSIISASMIALSVFFWRWWATRWIEPTEITKLVIGTAVSGIAPLSLALCSSIEAATGHKISLGWAIAFEFINDLGFANVFPVALAFYSRAAPKSLSGVMIGIFYLNLFIGNNLVGLLGGQLETMTAASFWLMHAGIVFISAALLLLARTATLKLFAPTKGVDVAAKPA